MSYTGKQLGEDLERELNQGFNIVKISRLAFDVYKNYGNELSSEIDGIVLSLMAMEEAPEFEMSEGEVWNLVKVLKEI